MSNNIHIASGPGSETPYTPYQLLAGDTPAVSTNDLTVANGLTLVQGEVVAMVGGEVVKHDPGAATGAENPIGVMCYDTDTTGGAARAAVYTAGCFNVAALTFHASLATVEDQINALVGSNIQARKLDWSGDTAHGSV